MHTHTRPRTGSNLEGLRLDWFTTPLTTILRTAHSRGYESPGCGFQPGF